MPPRDLLPFALPHGIKTAATGGKTGLLSVYFAPRLKANGRLKNYPDWKNWATTAGRLNIEVRVNGSIRAFTRVGPTVDPNVWKALFSPNTEVRQWAFIDRRTTPMKTFGEVSLVNDVGDVYNDVAVKYPDEPPTYEELLTRPGAGDLLSGDAGKSEVPAALDFMKPTGTRGTEKDPDWDFHQFLQQLNAHPYLLRVLGIVWDLEVPLPAGALSSVQVTTNIRNLFGGVREAELVTKLTPGFYPLENPDLDYREHKDGWLRLSEHYELLVLDSLTASQRLNGVATVAGQESEEANADRSGALPPLSERGVTLARADHAELLLNRFNRRRALEDDIKDNLNTGGAVVNLYSEDLTIGRRIDVKDNLGKTYRSLWHRQPAGPYELPRKPTIQITPDPDEGWNTTALATDENERYTINQGSEEREYKPTATRRVSETIFNWNGWSGAAPRPGQILDPLTGEAIPPPENKPRSGDPVQMAIDYEAVPGTLPRLRFGRQYWMRARAVDMAGNSRGSGEPHPSGTEPPPAFYGRLEPVGSPTPVRRGRRPFPGVGDQADVLVIKSDYDIDDATVAPTDRVLFPSSIPQTVVERHGLPKGGNDPNSYGVLKLRDALDIESQLILDAISGELVVGKRNGHPDHARPHEPKGRLPRRPGRCCRGTR